MFAFQIIEQCIDFYIELFPIHQGFIGGHWLKAVKFPIIILHYTVALALLAFLFWEPSCKKIRCDPAYLRCFAVYLYIRISYI